MYKFIVMSALGLSFVIAQVGPKLDISISNEKINMTKQEAQSGNITFTPGDTIQYTVTSKNIGDALLKDAVITDPIPAGVTYILNSSKAPDATTLFSIDGGKEYSEWPVIYTVRNSRGILIRREATADMVTHIRWELQKALEAGAHHDATFMVEVTP